MGLDVISYTEAKKARAEASINWSRSALPRVKLKGGNICPHPQASATSGDSSGPAAMWAEWDWDNWIKPQIDRAVALHMNAIRINCDPAVITANYSSYWPAITLSQYLARCNQLASYCQSKGLYLYPTITEHWAFVYANGSYNATPNFQDATVTANVVASAKEFARYPNVVAFDVFQEGHGYGDGYGMTTADCLAMFTALRSAAPGIPLTVSHSTNTTNTLFWLTQNTSTQLPWLMWTDPNGSDFIDIHMYDKTANPADVDKVLNLFQKPLLMGEYGSVATNSSADRSSLYTAAMQLHNRPGVLGSFVWALADQGGSDFSPNKQFGVWDNTGYTMNSFSTGGHSTAALSTTSGQRTDATAVIAKMSVFDPLPTRQYQQPNLLNAEQSRPLLDPPHWSPDGNTTAYADTTTGLGLAFKPTTVGTNTIALSSTTRFPCTAGVWYRFDGEMTASVSGRSVDVYFTWYDSSGSYLGSTSGAANTLTTPTNNHIPLKLSAIGQAPTNAVTGSPAIKVYTTTSTSEKYILLANPRPYVGPF